MSSIIDNGENITNLRQYLEEEENISSSDFDEKILKVCLEIFRRCSRGENGKKIKGLIYGHIQSGKTAVILTTMALAADNGYQNFIVMTSNLNDIYDQTLNRIKSSLDNFQVFGKKDFKNSIGGCITNSPSVLVVSKHRATLEKVRNIAQQLNWQKQPVMIIDDEADQASLDTNINNDDKPTSAINHEIKKLRAQLSSHDYLQTTATPQSLLLQDRDSEFKPDFVVTTIEGTGYVGGNYFFGSEEELSEKLEHICIVPVEDVTCLTSNGNLPNSVKNSILLFLLGATALRLSGHKKKYTYLLHTSHRQATHEQERELFNRFINDLKSQLETPTQSMDSSLKTNLDQVYQELKRTFAGSLPELTTLLTKVKITSTDVLTINASSKEPLIPPQRRHTIYIGGTRLGRGVTIKNLLVTYYGRDAQNAQMDTVLQHARMYGYRKEELPAIRIYLPQNLEDRFRDIHQIDNSLRDMCQEEHQAIRLIPLTENVKRLTRPNVLNQNTVSLHTYLGGKQYFPHLPISSPEELGNQTEELDKLLRDYEDKKTHSVTLDEIRNILNFKFATPTHLDTWKDELIRQAISSLMEQYGNKATLVVINRNANLFKAESRGFREIGSIIPENMKKRLKEEVDPNYPALFMSRNKGEREQKKPGGWNGVPFWIPVVQFPKGHYAFTANYS